MKRIYRTYEDTEIVKLAVKMECPGCEGEWLEEDLDECGTTYTIHCDGCGEIFEMHFDAS